MKPMPDADENRRTRDIDTVKDDTPIAVIHLHE
jgi:hypothetical protein